ncbi:MAG: 30S ribosomal protein S20 [Oscillospiraceae bacterium]|nr:30S ribosomal protein S20 [Oscillospiraceae bacterium]
MPNIKSAKKRVLVSAARNERNKANRTLLKTLIKRARAEGATADDTKTVSIKLDKAAGKGLIHKNKAARLKSRLAKAQKASA